MTEADVSNIKDDVCNFFLDEVMAVAARNLLLTVTRA
jgi:hypothetical protein